MISFVIKDDAGKKIRIESPSSWYELTLKQLIQIENTDKTDLVALFSILTGLTIEFAANSKDKKLEGYLWSTIQFVTVAPDWKGLKPPKKLTLGDNQYKIPTDFRDLMLGQKILIAGEFQEEEDIINKMPLLLAIIFQPILDDGKFKDKRIPKVIELMEGGSGLELYAIASFFFRHLWNSRRFSIRQSQTSPQFQTPTLLSLAASLMPGG